MLGGERADGGGSAGVDIGIYRDGDEGAACGDREGGEGLRRCTRWVCGGGFSLGCGGEGGQEWVGEAMKRVREGGGVDVPRTPAITVVFGRRR